MFGKCKDIGSEIYFVNLGIIIVGIIPTSRMGAQVSVGTDPRV